MNVAPVNPPNNVMGYQGGLAAAGAARGAAVASQALEQEGQTFGGLFKSAGEMSDNQDRLNYANGVQSFLNQKLQADKDAESDTDYSTLPDRYQKKLQTALGQTASTIVNPQLRAQFQDGMARYVEYGTNTIMRQSKAKAMDADRGWLSDFIDNGLNTATAAQDDSTRTVALQNINTAIDSMAGKGSITQVEAAKLKKSTAQGFAVKRATMLMDNDPAAAEKLLAPTSVAADGTPMFDKTGGFLDFMDPTKRMDMYRAAQQRAREKETADFVDQERRDAADRRAKDQANEIAANGIVQKLMTNSTSVDPIKDIANNPALKPTTKLELWRISKAGIDDSDSHDTKTYGPGFWDVYRRVHAADGDPNRITDPTQLYPLAGPHQDPTTGKTMPGQLTLAGVNALTNDIIGRRTPEGEAEQTMKRAFLQNARNEITGTNEGLHLRDPKGDQLYLKFLAQALPDYDVGRKAGKSATQLLNPDSPDYIGKSIQSFKRPLREWNTDMLDANAPGADNPNGIDLTTRNGIVSAYQAGKITKGQAGDALTKIGIKFAPTPAAEPVPPALHPPIAGAQ